MTQTLEKVTISTEDILDALEFDEINKKLVASLRAAFARKKIASLEIFPDSPVTGTYKETRTL